MNHPTLEPAALTFTDDGVPFSTRFDDIYHPRAGALAQARHVFLGGNGLPARWQGRERFVVLETGFGLGNNFLATWQAWRDDPQRCARLVFISIEAHPLTPVDLAAAHVTTPLPELAQALQRAWPLLTPDLHALDFDGGRVRLLLAFGDVHAWLPELIARADAFFLDGFAPARNPRMWDQRVCKALSRLAAPDATLATWSAARALREHLTTAGFETRLGQGAGGKRDITLARFAPAFTPRRAPARSAPRRDGPAHALIVGGGLAGCAAAWALAEQGWSSTLIERRATIAAEASGNPGALFHGIVNAQDGLHARFNRAASLMIHRSVQIAIDEHHAAGSTAGLLRLETSLTATAMKAVLERLRLPADYVQALEPSAAAAISGLACCHPAWFYPGGGWVRPADLSRAWLARAGGRVELRCGIEVAALQRRGDGWLLLDAAGQVVAEAPVVVLANAGEALRLLEHPRWPIDKVRGQISLLPASALAPPLPRVPLAGAGYLLPEIDGHAMFGATAQRGDDDATVRDSDHAANLAQLSSLLGHPVEAQALHGRTAWRWSAIDRLPVIGGVPDPSTAATRLDQPRLVPCLPGLFVFTALGSRGVTWSALGAEVLAATITGAPMPLEARVVDAISPARFVSRAARRSTRA